MDRIGLRRTSSIGARGDIITGVLGALLAVNSLPAAHKRDELHANMDFRWPVGSDDSAVLLVVPVADHSVSTPFW